MKFNKKLNPFQWSIVAACGVVLAFVLLVSVYFLSSAYSSYQEKARAIPQISRLKGLANMEGDLAEAAFSAEQHLTQLVYPASESSSALGNNMQQSMRQLFSRAGVNVSGSQVLPVVDEDVLLRVRLKLNAKADLDALIQLLSDIEVHQPMVLVDSLSLQPERRRKAGEQNLDVSIVLSSFALP